MERSRCVLVGADSYGVELKEAVAAHLRRRGLTVEDLGVTTAQDERPYYETAAALARRIAAGQAQRGVLVCGTGMGMAIVANKFPGVYAAPCENVEAARRARSINNANVLTLGQMVTPAEAAVAIVDAWLDTEFAAGWPPEVQAFLHQSMPAIRALEERARQQGG
ncbi:MAG: RpiB/LacA/LacB family sugar-phosphate isomerase [Myxococcales bacterium]|nr:RpiB/LacA/LacB family sugar-phosphate isomerase [Myxococcota bacterium]MDW8283906.1 RpiB/LacA/LacB family sugar-phosphate isomerase [Myxococcales bacterium]